MKILGIESSCDETAAAVVEGGGLELVRVLSNVISSQIDIHKNYGGIVPEVAAREHVLNILPVINAALRRDALWRVSGRRISTLAYTSIPRPDIDVIAVTIGPGLITSLQVGVETAKTLAYAWDLPVAAINHIEGHIYANLISGHKQFDFPAMILTVSGGHTMLVLIEDWGKYRTVGQTRDDAAGEAFDKAAQALGLGFPGGPEISKAAEKFDSETLNSNISLPRPMLNTDDFDFSFSGLKTALVYALKADSDWQKRIPEYAHEFQAAVVDVLVTKLIKAAKAHKAKTIMLTGGVSANARLRQVLDKTVKQELPETRLLIPNLEYTTDNAAMIAAAGYFHALNKDFTPWKNLKAVPNLEIS